MARLRRLWIRDFRNYARADLSLGDGCAVLVGANGQGKSNLLEAIYLVATGRSHRTANEAEAIRRGAGAARVRAQIERRGRDEELEVTLTAEAGRLTTALRVNGAPCTRGTLLGRLPVVLAAPWDLEIVRGAAGGRRRLLDAALAQLSPSYFFALHRYHRVLAQRNAAMRRHAPGTLEPWNAQLVALGVRITGHRAGYLQRLAPLAGDRFGALGGIGALALAYRPSWPGGTDEERSANAQEELQRRRADEYRRGATASGPHRDEVELLLDGAPLRAFGSQGQWRTALLAVRLAERDVMAADLGTRPVLLLDDALAELDPDRQRRVLEMDADAQVLATATTLPRVGRPVRVLGVREGTITEEAWSPHSGTS